MKDLIGKQLPDLFEKRLIVARYFIKQREKGIKMVEKEVYYMWNNLFRRDFRESQKSKLKWVDGQLISKSQSVPKKLLINYNRKWEEIYKWINKYVNLKKHSLSDCDNDIKGLRRKQYKELVRVYKPYKYYVKDTKADTGYSSIASYHIIQSNNQYCGSYSKLLEYLDKNISNQNKGN